VADATAIWFIQCVGRERRLVDYYEASGVGLDHYTDVLHSKRIQHNWKYGEHFFPHDIAHRELTTGKSRAAAWPLAARAQQSERVRRIGVLMAHPDTDPEFKAYVGAFREGLDKLGWTQGRNIHIDFRWGALDDAEARQRSAKELIALQPDVILAQNTPPTASMLQQTRTIPIVFVVVADPVGSGFVQSLARPGGNATGFTVMEPTISGKWVELLKEIAPRVNRAAVLFNPATTPYADIYLNPFKAAHLA
jgi:putative ABC transport system substrate-binding protein